MSFSSNKSGGTRARGSIDSDAFVSGEDERQKLKFLPRWIGLCAVCAALACGLFTFPILYGLTSIEPVGDTARTILTVNAFFVLLLFGVIVWELLTLYNARRRGLAASGLHIKIVALFGLVAATPAVFVAVLAVVTLDIGLDRWVRGAHPLFGCFFC